MGRIHRQFRNIVVSGFGALLFASPLVADERRPFGGGLGGSNRGIGGESGQNRFPYELRSRNGSSAPADTGGCVNVSRFDIAPPRISLGRVTPAGLGLGNRYRVAGAVEGVCIAEAGYFENGTLVAAIPTAPSRSFGRFPFEVEVQAGGQPEIRVFNAAGDYDVAPVPIPETGRRAPRQELEADRDDGSNPFGNFGVGR